MQSVLTAAPPAQPARQASAQASPACPAVDIRRSEWTILAFLFYAQGIAFLLQAPWAVQSKIAVWNCSVTLVYACLLYFDSFKPGLASSIARDWLPLAVVLLAYREM